MCSSETIPGAEVINLSLYRDDDETEARNNKDHALEADRGSLNQKKRRQAVHVL